MGRRGFMTPEDKQQYCRDYYHKTKGERAHEYALVSKRAYLRKRVKELEPESDKAKNMQYHIDAITRELEQIRLERWHAKRDAGGALFKRFDTINEQPININ